MKDRVNANAFLPKPAPGSFDRNQVLATPAAATFVGLAESTLEKLRVSGSGPPYCKLGRRVVYRVGDLIDWLEASKTHNTTQGHHRRVTPARDA